MPVEAAKPQPRSIVHQKQTINGNKRTTKEKTAFVRFPSLHNSHSQEPFTLFPNIPLNHVYHHHSRSLWDPTVHYQPETAPTTGQVVTTINATYIVVGMYPGMSVMALDNHNHSVLWIQEQVGPFDVRLAMSTDSSLLFVASRDQTFDVLVINAATGDIMQAVTLLDTKTSFGCFPALAVSSASLAILPSCVDDPSPSFWGGNLWVISKYDSQLSTRWNAHIVANLDLSLSAGTVGYFADKLIVTIGPQLHLYDATMTMADPLVTWTNPTALEFGGAPLMKLASDYYVYALVSYWSGPLMKLRVDFDGGHLSPIWQTNQVSSWFYAQHAASLNYLCWDNNLGEVRVTANTLQNGEAGHVIGTSAVVLWIDEAVSYMPWWGWFLIAVAMVGVLAGGAILWRRYRKRRGQAKNELKNPILGEDGAAL